MSRLEDLVLDAVEFARRRVVLLVALIALLLAAVIGVVMLGGKTSSTSTTLPSVVAGTPSPACASDMNAIKAVIAHNPAALGEPPASVMTSYHRSFASVLHDCTSAQVTLFVNQTIVPWVTKLPKHAPTSSATTNPQHATTTKPAP